MKATGMEEYSEAKPLAQIERHSHSEVGWISRQTLLALRSRENFFLDIPFYRTHKALRRFNDTSPDEAAFHFDGLTFSIPSLARACVWLLCFRTAFGPATGKTSGKSDFAYFYIRMGPSDCRVRNHKAFRRTWLW